MAGNCCFGSCACIEPVSTIISPLTFSSHPAAACFVCIGPLQCCLTLTKLVSASPGGLPPTRRPTPMAAWLAGSLRRSTSCSSRRRRVGVLADNVVIYWLRIDLELLCVWKQKVAATSDACHVLPSATVCRTRREIACSTAAYLLLHLCCIVCRPAAAPWRRRVWGCSPQRCPTWHWALAPGGSSSRRRRGAWAPTWRRTCGRCASVASNCWLRSTRRLRHTRLIYSDVN